MYRSTMEVRQAKLFLGGVDTEKYLLVDYALLT